MNYGYARVSSRSQNLDRQIEELKAFGLLESQLYVDQQSGKDFDRQAYRQLKEILRAQDLLVIKSIDRLGRNYQAILEEWADLTKRLEVQIVVLDMPLLDTRSRPDNLVGCFISDLVLQILSFVAENERINRIKAIQRHGNLENYIAVHNFFPHPDTGMSFTDTFKNAKLFKACGIRTGVFINSLDADNLLFPYGHGLCTVENHRYKPAYLSAGELTATGMFDYIFFGDGNPSRTEMEQVQEIVHQHCVSVPVYFNSRLDDALRQKLLNAVLKSRSDQPEFILRATQTRGLGPVAAQPGLDRDKLCITLDNELSGKYEGELQIALKSMPGVEYATVIGQVDMLAENLISLIRYGKVAFRLVEAEKIQNATVGQEQTQPE